MWAAEAITAKEISFGEDYTTWDNERLRLFIREKRTKCVDFDKALIWLEGRNYKQAVDECKNIVWLSWLKENIKNIEWWSIPKGTQVTITKGRNYEYAVWGKYIVDTPAEYIEKIVRVFAQDVNEN